MGRHQRDIILYALLTRNGHMQLLVRPIYIIHEIILPQQPVFFFHTEPL